MTTELSPGNITSILEAVPGIATVLRSPVADAIVNLSRAASGMQPFDKKDALELIRYAVRRGLIRSDEGDRVTAEVEAAAAGRPLAPMPPPRKAAVPVPVPVRRPFAMKKAAPKAAPAKKKAAHKAAPKAKKK